MKNYFLGLILFAFFGSVILSVAPHGLSRGYLKFLCGLCSIGCIIFPIASVVVDGDAWRENVESFFEIGEDTRENSVEIYNLFLDEVAEENAELSLKNKIITELKGDNDDIAVDIILDKNSDEIYIEAIRVFFYPSGYDIDPKKVKKICFLELGVECEVFYK